MGMALDLDDPAYLTFADLKRRRRFLQDPGAEVEFTRSAENRDYEISYSIDATYLSAIYTHLDELIQTFPPGQQQHLGQETDFVIAIKQLRSAIYDQIKQQCKAVLPSLSDVAYLKQVSNATVRLVKVIRAGDDSASTIGELVGLQKTPGAAEIIKKAIAVVVIAALATVLTMAAYTCIIALSTPGGLAAFGVVAFLKATFMTWPAHKTLCVGATSAVATLIATGVFARRDDVPASLAAVISTARAGKC